MELPVDFITLMKEQLGLEQAESLFCGLSAEPEVSVRLNTRKIAKNPAFSTEALQALTPVPWCPDAYYLAERPAFTFDPLFHAGVYYVQEAGSMYLSEVLRQFMPMGSPLAALDLCAAPGGKSTLLCSHLPEGSLLVSNEPMPKRAQVLAENMQKWGYEHSIVTQNYPADYTMFHDAFDLIVTDVPCSGEGMFRKDEGAIRDWSLDNVHMCQERQRGILEDIWPALKPGGLLIYSTCTFNRFEDEDNVRWIASHLGADILVERHFFPGRDRGEGFFIAALRKAGEWEAFDDFRRTLRSIRTLRVLFDAEKQASPEGVSVELTYDQALQYLRREAVRVECPRGPVVLTYRGFPLGLGKGVGNRINNLYPQEWRIRTTYTQRFELFPTR